MIDNPYCRCGRHLGMPFHNTREHNYAESVPEEDNTARIVSVDTVDEIAGWCGGKAVVEHDALDHDRRFPAVNVPTRSGLKRAAQGDYVIQQDDGSFEVMGASDYERTHH